MSAGAPSGWRHRIRTGLGTVRVRTTVAAVVIVGVALLLGALALVGVMRNTLTREIRSATRLRATEVAAAFKSAEGAEASLTVPEADEQLIQILDEAGDVVASSTNVDQRPAVAPLAPGESAEISVRIDADEVGEFVAVAIAADTPQGRRTIIVASALEDVIEATRVVTSLLTVGLPALLVVVAITTLQVVGRALAPVEAIRREVDEISAVELFRRVPNPSGDDEISRLASTMNRMLERLEDAQSTQRRFVSDASHELRSPVASIRQHAEVAMAHPGRTTIGELAETVLAEDLRVQRLVEDLLLLARADERTLAPGDRGVDLDDLVFDEARRLRTTTTLQVDVSAVSAARVRGDQAQLRRIFRNLGDNAARHARSRITFSLGEHHNGSVVLRVDDDGDGIAAGERQRVFERFVRLDEARARDHGGSGLGLAIVAEVVAAHGGTAVASEAPQGGGRFEVRLPILAD